MAFDPKKFAGAHCGCRYQQDYRPTLGKDGKKESGTLEVIKFYYDGAIRMEQHCYGEAATFVFGVWAEGMDADGTLAGQIVVGTTLFCIVTLFFWIFLLKELGWM